MFIYNIHSPICSKAYCPQTRHSPDDWKQEDLPFHIQGDWNVINHSGLNVLTLEINHLMEKVIIIFFDSLSIILFGWIEALKDCDG